ncbi:ATP-binding protein [Candidatus Sumerlaeota bacterium]|nr:ATP-binding protein [Candidatus Sumerlaeota bacterium]
MSSNLKGNSPFYPGQPVPVELFSGREEQLRRILERGVAQVERGKPVAMFIQGEYGIGKSSIAGYTQYYAERNHGLHRIYAPLGAINSIDEVGSAILKATVQSGAMMPNREEIVRDWLSKYIGEQELFGVKLHFDALRKDGPQIANGILPFLHEICNKLSPAGVKGVFLVLDEINGITQNPRFAHFIKGLIDENALSSRPVPLLLMLCGVEERRQDMIQRHEPVGRIFDIIDVEPMPSKDVVNFFRNAFESVQFKVETEALHLMAEYSSGFPKIMHIIGDAAFWLDQDGTIDPMDAIKAVMTAAEEVGKRYVDQQVYRALRSEDYHNILRKIAEEPLAMKFQKRDIAEKLTTNEKKKFNNFLQRMKKLNVIRSGDVSGEYIFNVRMSRLYIGLQNFTNTRNEAQGRQ